MELAGMEFTKVGDKAAIQVKASVIGNIR